MLEKMLGSKNERDLKALTPLVGRVNELEAEMIALDDDAFPATTAKLRDRVAAGAELDDLLPEAFALVREAARRRLGERIYDCQLMGGAVLHRGSIVEMKTGEGKTLASITAAYVNALTGRGVHIVTVNDYLAERDADWMGRVFDLLGISVGVILNNMDNARRHAAYRCDVTYGTNNEFGFDYLRDNMQWDEREKVQRGHHFCIVDEIDSILIDEARTPLIISGAADDDTARFAQINTLVGQLTEVTKDPATGEYPDEAEGFVLEGDYKVDEKGKRISFTDEGMNSIERILKQRKIITDTLFTDDNFELIHYFTQALRAHRLFHRDVDYVVQDGKVEIVDEFTGRILHGRRYSDGLHQAIEAKEKIRILQRSRTVASITFQNYFKLYDKLAGMTGTADTEATEFSRIYGLDVVVIPTNRPVIRRDEDDVIFATKSDKLAAIGDEIAECHERGQPVLVGTVSIEKSEQLSTMLLQRGIRHEVLNAKNHAREATIIAQAGGGGRGDHCHQHGGARHRHQARRQRGLRGAQASKGSAERPGPRPGGGAAQVAGELRAGSADRRAQRDRHRAPRVAPHRQSIARPLRAAGRPRPLAVLHLPGRRSDAAVWGERAQHDRPRRADRRRAAGPSVDQQVAGTGTAPDGGAQLRAAQAPARLRQRAQRAAQVHLRQA